MSDFELRSSSLPIGSQERHDRLVVEYIACRDLLRQICVDVQREMSLEQFDVDGLVEFAKANGCYFADPFVRVQVARIPPDVMAQLQPGVLYAIAPDTETTIEVAWEDNPGPVPNEWPKSEDVTPPTVEWHAMNADGSTTTKIQDAKPASASDQDFIRQALKDAGGILSDDGPAKEADAVALLRKHQWASWVRGECRTSAHKCPECGGLRPGDSFHDGFYIHKGIGHTTECLLAEAIGYWTSSDPEGWFTDRPAPAGKTVEVKRVDGSIWVAQAIYHPSKSDPPPHFMANNGEVMQFELCSRVFPAWREITE